MPKVKIKKVPIMAQNDLQVEDNNLQPLSPFTGLITGDKHSTGGEQLQFGGQVVEAEGGEPLSIDNQGNLQIFGNLRIPGSQTKFKTAAKKIGEQEGKATKQNDKAQELIAVNDPYDKYESLSFTSGLVKQDAANQKLKKANQQKELLGNLQQMILDGSQLLGVKPEQFEKTVKKAQNGTTLFQQPTASPFNIQYPNWQTAQYTPPPAVPVNRPSVGDADYVQESLVRAAQQVGVDPDLLQKVSFQESDFRPGVKGVNTKYGTAYGHIQMLPGTAKEYGITPAQLKSKKPEDIDAVSIAGAKHLQKLIQKHYGDRYLALAEYNGGQGAIKDVQKGLGKKDITGEEAIAYWQAQNEKNPSTNPNLYRNQTLNYITNIVDTPTEEFYASKGRDFRQTYYTGQEGTVPKPNVRPTYTDPSIPTAIPYDTRKLIPGAPDELTPVQASLLQDQIAARAPVSQPYTPPQQQVLPSLADRNRLNPLDFLPEIGAILDRPDYVQGQQYTPQLMQNTSYSFQDRLNANQGTFNALARNFANNPAALATLAGQQYGANQQVLGDEFRTNQASYNQISNQNNQILNSAELQNIQLNDLQFQRQSQAQANTDASRQAALNSISNKYAVNRAQNNDIRMIENLSNYRLNDNLQTQNYNQYNWNQPGASNPVPLGGTPEEIKLQTAQAKQQKAMYDAESAKQRAAKKNNNLFSNLFGRR